ncbi:MAG: SDR family NAD(P)-dependent oxidoreductase [Bacillota bacterium]
MYKVMLITGANKGIGYFITKSWLEKGNKAVVLDVNCDEINKLKKLYDKLYTYICDVTDEKLVKVCVDESINIYGRIDIAIHNACTCIFKGIEEHSLDEYIQTYNVNLIGAVNLTKAVLPHMRKSKNGRICYVSSGVGVTGYTKISGYSASKGAIEAFAKCMILENLDSGISFHILHPPLTDTESSSPLPVPKEFKADAAKVGRGFVKNILKKRFIITPSLFDSITVKISYWFPQFTGKMLVKMTQKAK